MDWWSVRNGNKIDLQSGINEITIVTGPILLRADNYYINFIIFDSTGIRTIFWSYLEHTIKVSGSSIGSPVQMPEGFFKIRHL
jgi:hypothetical protein